MPSPPTEEGSDVPTTENYVQVANEAGQSSSQEVLGGARVSASAAAAVETRPTPTCCVCTKPWSCSGAHRIWSCLEKCLGACGNTSAKCPQCGAGFEQKHIINIYTPGDLFDGCSRMQGVEEHYYSKIVEFRAGFMELVAQHMSEKKLEMSKAKASPVQHLDHMIESLVEMQSRHYSDLAQLVCQNLNGLGEANPK